MPHTAARRRRGAGYKADRRLFALGRFEERGAVLLGMAADLADHDDRLGLVIGEKHLEHIGEIEPVDRVAADPDAARLPEPRRTRLRHRFIGQRARSRHDADFAAPVDMPRHDADLAFVGRDDPRAVRPDEDALRSAERALHPHHVEDRDALGDAHDQFDPGIDRFEDRVGGIGRRHINDTSRRAGPGARLLDRVEHRQVEMLGAALARGHAADHPRAVGDRLLGVKGALRAGEALADHRRRRIDQDRHSSRLRPSWCRRRSPARNGRCPGRR